MTTMQIINFQSLKSTYYYIKYIIKMYNLNYLVKNALSTPA